MYKNVSMYLSLIDKLTDEQLLKNYKQISLLVTTLRYKRMQII